ncbi:MAG: glycoside hydrolase family 13 protein [Dorea sp.]|nr:glycoside hydrolase family 13 protein [Dorea sp.]
MKEQALFTDGTTAYVFPLEPVANSKVTIRFRTAKDDVDSVTLLSGKETRIVLKKERTTSEFDYYMTQIDLGTEIFKYCFEIVSGDTTVFYCKNGPSVSKQEQYQFMLNPGFSTPDWAKGAVMYQIYTDRFFNGDPSNDVEDREYYYIDDYTVKVKDWSKYPATMGVREFYGGDLQGVMDKLDYLQDLGIEVIYFNPLFVSPSNHKYDIQDYDYIDPHIGKIVEDGGEVLGEGVTENCFASKYQKRVTDFKNLEASNQFFIQFVEELHRRGMKIILDGVFNHCGSFNKWMDRERIYEGQEGYAPGAFVSATSPYHNYFKFVNNNASKWPYNKDYEGWWDHNTLPKLNFEDSEELQDYIMEIGKKWVSPPYNIDGWRLDVAADLGHTLEFNHKFWKRFRKVVKEANPQAIIIAEHYGDATGWLQGDEWDTIMNYDAFMEPVTWYLTGMEKHSDQYREDLLGNGQFFANSMKHNMAFMMMPTVMTSMNQLSNHDHSRFLTRTNHVVGRVTYLSPEKADENVDVSVMRQAIIMQMTWPGAPTLYYGDEAGVCGFTDPDNRRTYPWGKEDKELLTFYKEAIALHKQYHSLRFGSIKILKVDGNVIAYSRFDDRDAVVVVVNSSDKLKQISVPVWLAEIPMDCTMFRRFYSYKDGYTTDYEEWKVKNGEVIVNMGANSVLVLAKRA